MTDKINFGNSVGYKINNYLVKKKIIQSEKKQTALCVTPCKYSPRTESKKIRPS